MSIKPIPDGFHAVTPYLFAQGASRLIEFISAAFDGELTSHQAEQSLETKLIRFPKRLRRTGRRLEF
jgi:hypothetical protein